MFILLCFLYISCTYEINPQILNFPFNSVEDLCLNRLTEKTTIRFKASVFKGSGKIYFQSFKQAHLSSYFNKQKTISNAALDLAYEDIKNCFQYNLNHYYNERPVIIASQSQGTKYDIRHLQDFFDSKSLMKQLVSVHLIGMPVYDSLFLTLIPCDSSEETGCYISCSIRFASNISKEVIINSMPLVICTDSLTLKNVSSFDPYPMNKGGLLKNFNDIYPKLTDANE